MKRKLLGTLSFILMTMGVNAQCTISVSCTPAGSGYCTVPANNAYFPSAEVDAPFSQVIQVNTETTFGGAPVNSMGISSSSLPAGLTASYNPASGVVSGGEAACILISGTPTSEGFNQTVEFNAVADIGGSFVPITLTYYLDINASSASLKSISGTETFKVSPNPANSQITLSADRPMTLVITNLLGKEIDRMTVDNATKVDVSNWTNGIYLIINEEGETLKFLKY